jgi:nucleotide-binding universal stress UspA family protein
VVGHTLVIYRSSERADAALRELVRIARERGGRLTVLALAVEEPVRRGCCDTRSVLWNRIQREFAASDLARARVVVDDAPEVEVTVLVHSGRGASEAIEREARRRGADEIVIADPRACGLSRREQRRMRAAALAA